MVSKILVFLTLFVVTSMSYGYEFIHHTHLFCNSQQSEPGSQVMFILDKVGLLTVPGQCHTLYSPQDYSEIKDFHFQINHEKIKTKYIALAPFSVPTKFIQSSFKVCVTVSDCGNDDCKYKVNFLKPEKEC